MSVSATYQSKVTAYETLDDASLGDAQVRHDQFNTTHALTASTTPPVTKIACFQQVLTTGAATIDLTALVGTNGAAVDGSGLKVQMIKIIALAANANVITLTVGVANGYDLAGAAMSVGLLAGQEILLFGNDATPDIGAADCELDLAGTGAQGVNVVIVMG